MNVVNLEPGERVDAGDAQAIAESALDVLAEFVSKVIVGDDAATRGIVLYGFATTHPSGSLISVSSGVALLPSRANGAIRPALVAGEGPASQTVDIGAYPGDGSTPIAYGVYIRYELTESASQNRQFWDDVSNPAQERTRPISTRKTASWGVAIEQSTPGEEWTLIAEVTKGASITIVDKRDLFFEGPVTDPNATWGDGADDRDLDRRAHGVFGFRRAFALVRRQLAEVISAPSHVATWMHAVPASLSYLYDNALNKSGESALDPDDVAAPELGRIGGHLNPATDNAHDLGTEDSSDDHAPRRWRVLNAARTILGNSMLGSAANALIARITADFTTNRMCIFSSTRAEGSTAAAIRLFRTPTSVLNSSSTNAMELTLNCTWNSADDHWYRDANVPAYKLEVGLDEIGLLRHPASVGGGADAWLDEIGAAKWIRVWSLNPLSGAVQAGALTYNEAQPRTRIVPTLAFMNEGAVYSWSAITTGAGDLAAYHDSANAGGAFWPLGSQAGETINDVTFVYTLTTGATLTAQLLRMDDSSGHAAPVSDPLVITTPAVAATATLSANAWQDVTAAGTYYLKLTCTAAGQVYIYLINAHYDSSTTLP